MCLNHGTRTYSHYGLQLVVTSTMQYGAIPQPSGQRSASIQNTRRLFIGNLPKHLTAENIKWLVYYLTGCDVCWVDVIVHWKTTRQRSGCAHVYVDDRVEDQILAVHLRAFCGADVVFYASDWGVMDANAACVVDRMRNNGVCLNGPITVELSTSNYRCRPGS